MSQAYYNSPFQQPHDFTAETNLPEYSNPYSLAPEHIPYPLPYTTSQKIVRLE